MNELMVNNNESSTVFEQSYNAIFYHLIEPSYHSIESSSFN